MPNEIYDFLKENGLTQLDEAKFVSEYSTEPKAKELHKFMAENNLTQLDFDGFYDKYLKGDRLSEADVRDYVSRIPNQAAAGIDVEALIPQFKYKTRAEAEAMLGKPSAEPRGASGLAQKSVGSPMVTEAPVPTQPTQSSAPQYLSPEELGGVQTMDAEVQPMPQTTQREVPTPQQTKPFEDELTQKILRADILKKKAEESKKASESYKGSKLGALYNSLIESYTGTVNDAVYTTLSVMETVFPQGVDPETAQDPDAKANTVVAAMEDMGIKKTLDDQLKSKGTTEAYVERLKNEGGIVTQGVLGLAESAFPIATPMQSGFFVTSFADAHKDIKESMPDLSPDKMLAYATTQGTVAMALEKVGLSNLIGNKSVIKNITGRVLQSLKGAGKVTPDVLESKVGQVVNGFASEFETGATQYVVEEGVRQIADALEGEGDSFKFEGMEEFIGNTLKAGVAEGIGGGLMKGVGVAASSILTPKSKEKAQAATTEIEQMAQDIDNPNVSPEAKEAIKKQIDQKAEEILDAYAEEQELVAKLPQESIDKINEANTAIDRFNSIVNDPNVSDASKAMAEENIKALTKDIEIILESAPKEEEEFLKPIVTDTEAVEVTEEKPEPTPVAEEVVAEEEVVFPKSKDKGTYYHGTPFGQIKEFDEAKIGSNADEGFVGDYGKGFYFGTSEEGAKTYATGEKGNVVSVKLNMENPLDFTKLSEFDKKVLEERRLKKISPLSEDYEKLEQDVAQDLGFTLDEIDYLRDLSDRMNDNWSENEFRKELKEKGYDSVIAPNGERVVFDKNQIKIISQTISTQPEQQQTPTENPALANVEATAKALDGVENKKVEVIAVRKNIKPLKDMDFDDAEANANWKKIQDEKNKLLTDDKYLSEQIQLVKEEKKASQTVFEAMYGQDPRELSKSVSEAYHKAKADGSNPELVQAVENLLTPQTDETQVQTPTQAEAESTEAAVPQAERGGASQEEAVNQVPADTVVAVKEGFTESKDLNRIFKASKQRYGEKDGAKYNDVVNRLANPNENTIIEVRSNGVVVKENNKFLFKPFTNTDANYKKWQLGKPIDISEQFDWRRNFDTESDEFKKAAILRSISDVSNSDSELRDILDRLGDSEIEASNISWSVMNNPNSSQETFDIAAKNKFLLKGTTQENIDSLREKRFGKDVSVSEEVIVEPQTPPQDATQERNIEQSNLTEREGIAQQKQGQGADRLDQEANVQEGEAEAGRGDSVAEGRAEKKVTSNIAGKQKVYRVEGMKKSSKKSDVTFYSLDRDYVEEFYTGALSNDNPIIESEVSYENAIKVLMPNEEFSDPNFEKKYIEQAINNGNDAIIFENEENGDTFVAIVNKSSVQNKQNQPEQKIAQTAKSIADVIRQGKINKPGYLQANAGALVWDGAIEVIATAVEKGGDLAQAIANGFEHIRKSDYYKGLTEKDRRRFIKDFTRSVNQLRRDFDLPLDPILSIGEMDMSSLKTRLIKGSKLPKYVKDGIEEKGIAYEVENQDLARDYANALIDILGLDAAVDLALKGKVKGGTKTFILGANVDAFANTPNTPEFFEAVEIFDEALRTAGEEISAAYRVYLNSPDGLYHYERKRVRKDIDAEITKGEKGKNIEATKKKAKRARKEKAKDVAKEVVDGLTGKNQPSVTEKKVNPDAAKKKAALDKLAKAKEKLRKARGIATTGGLNPEAIEALVEIGVANIELGYLNAKAWLRKMKEDIKGIVDVSDAELLDILETAKDTDGKSLAEKMEEAKWDAGKEKLAERIAAQMEAPEAKDFDPVKTVVDNLFSKVAEQQKVEKKKPLTNIEKAKVTIENYQKARELWAKAKAEVVDLIDKMEISDELKSAYIFDLDIFLERTMGLGISESSATTIVKDQIKALTNDKSLRDSIEKILAQSVDGRAKTKEEFINQISKELELNTSLSPAQAEYIAKQFANRYEAVVSEEMKKFLNQQFPDRVKENQKEKEKQNAAIVREIIWGALNDSEFASKFYEKYGFGYVNDPAFNQELRRLAENIYKAPQGFLKQQAMDELASYVRVSRDGIRYWSLPMNLMVNNLLLGPETFLKAIDSNTIQTIAATGQMIASDPKNTKFYLEKMFKEQGEGVINLQLRKIGFWMGIKGIQSYRDSDVAGLELGKELEKYGKSKFARGFGKYIQMSNKGLSAVDLIYSKSGEFAKFAQLVLRNIQIENNKLPKDQRASKSEMQALANEILGNTSDRVQAAYTQALKEIKENFGVDEVVMGNKNPSKEEVALKARIIEILEQGRAERLNDVKQKVDWLDAFTEQELEIYTKYSKMYGEKVSLMGTPRGSAGFISLSLQGLGRNAPILKYIQVAPIFVNAPMNFGNLVIDSTPLGILRAGIFAAKGRRGAVIGREQALRQGEITRTESEMIFAMERNALIARVVSLNAMTLVGLAAMGFNFFRSPDDEEEEFTKEKFKQMPYYVTAGISPSREKVIEVEKAFGIEPYTVYSYGRKVLNYRNSAMIAPFAMQGAMMDAQNFRTNDIETNLDLYAAASIATIAFISEQSAMKGFSETLGAMAGIGKYEKDVDFPDRMLEAAKRNLASTTKAMIMPRLIPALYKDFQGIMEMDKTRATTFRDFLVEDVPFLEDMIVTKQVDHFGEPIKEEFFMPSPFGGLSLIGWDKGFFKGPFNEITQTNPYYQMAFSAGYTPKAYRDDELTKEMTAKEFETFQPLSKAEIAAKKETDVKGIYIVELDLTPEQVAEINRLRGRYVKKYLDDNKTKFNTYSKSERKEIFERLFEVGTKYAKTKVTGVDYVGEGNFKIEKPEITLPSME